MNSILTNTVLTKPTKILHFSEIGSRSNQEDAYFISADKNLFVVCDGVGGSINGGYASSKLVREIEVLYNDADICDHKALIEYLILESNKALVKELNTQNHNSSTTIALLYINGSTAFIAHIGDSKIYYISAKNKEWWASKDHSYVQELFEAGIIETEQEMKSHPLRTRITRAICNDKIININDVDMQKVEGVQKGDIFIICTDGVLEKLQTSDIVELFSNAGQSFEKSFLNLKEICTNYSKDNYTAIGIFV